MNVADVVRRAPVDLLIVGAGPCGLAAAIAAKRAGLSACVLDRGAIVSGIAGYPTYMTFFSTAERLEIGGVPFIVASEKPTRRDALAYYRTVASLFALEVFQFECVERIEPVGATAHVGESAAFGIGADTKRVTDTMARPHSHTRTPRWLVHSRSRSGINYETPAHAVVIATGYFGRPNRIGVPGGDLAHVRHGYVDGHYAWNQDVVIVGGGNSAVDAALEMFRAGARVTLVHAFSELDKGVKPWVRPEIMARIADGSIDAMFDARVVTIDQDTVDVMKAGQLYRIMAHQVYEMTGYLPETGLLRAMGVPIDAETGIPAHDPITMATPLPGVYLAGVIASGNQANRIFIENGRDHGDQIVASLTS